MIPKEDCASFQASAAPVEPCDMLDPHLMPEQNDADPVGHEECGQTLSRIVGRLCWLIPPISWGGLGDEAKISIPFRLRAW